MRSIQPAKKRPSLIGLEVQFRDGPAVPVADEQVGVIGPNQAGGAAQIGSDALDFVAVNHRRFRARSVRVDLPGHEQRYEKRNHREHVPSHLFTLSVVDFQRFG